MTDSHVFTIQIKYILTRCYVCFKSSFLKHRRHYRHSWSAWLSSTLALPLILLSKDNIYPELGINHLPAHFCIFSMYVPTPENFTVRFWQINSHHSAISRLFCVKWPFFLSLPVELRKALTAIATGGITEALWRSKHLPAAGAWPLSPGAAIFFEEPREKEKTEW